MREGRRWGGGKQEGDSDEGEDEEEELEEQAVVFADVVSVGRRVGNGESS
jgi:hypothetical protein